MSFYIGIEDLAANGLIEVMSKYKKRFLSYKQIEEYGSRVVEFLNESGEKAVLILSRESTMAMYRDYSDYFEEQEVNGGKGIKLRDGIEIGDLIARFRGYLALEVLLAMVNEKTSEVLGE